MSFVRYVDISPLGDEGYQRLYALASPRRKARADRYFRREDSIRCVTAEALLRYAVSRQLGVTSFTVEQTPAGKPFLPAYPDFCFSLSHSGSWVTIAWGSTPVGIDVERLRMDSGKEQIARRFFHPDEQAYLFENNADFEKRFFQIWTMKESYLKYLGTGIDRSLASFCVLDLPELCFHCSFLQDAAMTLCCREQTVNMECLAIEQL